MSIKSHAIIIIKKTIIEILILSQKTSTSFNNFYAKN